jgi:hypothetical protein
VLPLFGCAQKRKLLDEGLDQKRAADIKELQQGKPRRRMYFVGFSKGGGFKTWEGEKCTSFGIGRNFC